MEVVFYPSLAYDPGPLWLVSFLHSRNDNSLSSGLGKTALVLFLAPNPTISQVHLPCGKHSYPASNCLMGRTWQMRWRAQGRTQGKRRRVKISKGRVSTFRENTLPWDYIFFQRSLWGLELSKLSFCYFLEIDIEITLGRIKRNLPFLYKKWKCSKKILQSVSKHKRNQNTVWRLMDLYTSQKLQEHIL